MMVSEVDALNSSFEKMHNWMTELAEDGEFYGEAQAYSAFRAVMHALRDRLTVENAAHLGAQLPMVARGLFYEGWKPSAVPQRIRTRSEFLEAIGEHLGLNSEVDPERAAKAVFGLLDRKISAGEIDNIRNSLPAKIQELWC